MTSINAKKPAFRCPTFSVPSKSKETTHEEETEKKPLPKETCVLKKPTSEGIDISTDDLAVKENEENEKNKEEPSADEVTATGDAKPLVQKKTLKKKPAFHIKAKEEEAKDAGQVKKPKKVKAEKSASEPKEKKEKLPKTAKEPKAKKEVIPKPPKEPKVKKEAQPKPAALPVRSLTDEEYVAIFTAAIESAMAIDIEEWEPKESEQMVKKLNTHSSKKAAEELAKSTCDLQKSGQPFRPAKLENKVTHVAEEKPCVDDTKEVDRIDDDHNNDDEPENSSRTANENGAIENNNKVDKENQGDEVDEKNQGEEDNEKIDDEARDNENGEVDENNNAVRDDNQVLGQDNESIDLVQNQNETTPEGSEMNYGATPAPAPPACASPPIKKKKVSGLKKKRKLEPKSLSFQEETVNTTDDKDEKEREDTVKPSAPKKKTKDTPVGDKIKKLKQMRKERAERKEKKSLDKCTKQKKVKDEIKEEKQSPSKPAEKKRNKKKIMQQRQVANDGTWVQCCNEECLKWRYLPDVNDPAEVPERWVCNMNTREDYNSCEKAEEKYDESEHIYTKFTEGSIVWAKMTGYPWWPAMIEMDPDVETYFEAHSMTPTYYHVVFFDDKVSRSWVKVDNCKLFTGSEEDDNIKQVQVKKGPSYIKEIANAKKNAQKALKYCLQERIELFGFAARYHGKWGNINQESIVNDLKKGSEKRKLKCKDLEKGKKRKRSVLEDDDERSEDLLDDEEIESVINNTESFLDNVEDVLHSLDSQLDDSDEDSDFNPDEVLPKKSRKCESSEPEISSDAMEKLQVESVTDSKAELKAVDTEVEHQETEINKDKEDLITQEPVTQDKNIHDPVADSGKELNINNISDDSDQIVPEKDQVNTSVPIKFDPEIFTMEIDDDSDIKVEKSSENKGKCDTGSAASRKRTKGKAFKAPAASEDKMKEKGSSGPKKKEKKLKNQKNEKNVIKSDSQEKDGTDETGDSELKLEGNLNPNESKQPVNDKTISSDNKLELRTAVPFISSQEKIDSKPPENNSNKEDSGDEFDLTETSVLDNEAIKQMSDRKSDNKLRTAVPFISSQEKTDSTLLEDQDNSMKEDSDDDFDLAETSMFDNDPVIEKVSHMEVVNVPVMQSQESDSDPFDMMEE